MSVRKLFFEVKNYDKHRVFNRGNIEKVLNVRVYALEKFSH